MSRINTVISDLENTLKKGGLSPQLKNSLGKKLKHLKKNTSVNKN